MSEVFDDRRQAGRVLSQQISLTQFEKLNTIVLALPRGGVPVAFEIAEALQLPLDVLIARKIGHPLYPEYGIGAITEDQKPWLDPEALGVAQLSEQQIETIIKNEKKEIWRRIEKYRYRKPLRSLKGKIVILVDDGLATGGTARVAIGYIKSKEAKRIILAIPVGAQKAIDDLKGQVDDVVCLNQSTSFLSVGRYYRDFKQLSDHEVVELLNKIRFNRIDQKLSLQF